MARSLDIRFPQVLVHYPEDANGCFWHHRILLYRVGSAATWICLTPDYELVRLDLGEIRHRVIGRSCFFPAAVNAGEIYAFDPVSSADLEQFRKDAMVQSRILAAEDETVVERELWVISGPPGVVGDDRIGIAIAQDVQDDAARFRELSNLAVAEVDGSVVFAQRVSEDRLASWTVEQKASGRDDRTLPVVVRNGRRYQELRSCLTQYSEQTYDDWRFPGPRVAKEYLTAIDEAGGFVAYEREWEISSGVNPNSSAAHEHRTGNESLRLGVEYDMLDASNCALFENLCRRQVQLEIAVERNAIHPDFSGLSEASGGTTTDSGAATVAKFREFIAGRQKDRANILKNARLERDERDSLSRRTKEARPKAPAKGTPKGGASKDKKAKKETEEE
jgi:hypothetical protein